MNAERLLEHYDRIASAPDAIARLRRFILDLAVRGKLVPQDQKDEPASELLDRIAAEKARVVGRLSSRGRHSEGRERTEQFEFSLPSGWALSTLGSITLKITDGAHKTPTYVGSGVPFVSIKDFSAGHLDFSNTRFITEDEHSLLYKRCDPKRGDILIGRIGTLGRAVLIDTDEEFSLFVSVGLIRFSHKNLVPNFFRMLLNSPLVEREFDRIKIGGGTHTNKLNLGDLQTVALPVPPIAEQRRIVAKVDELTALCHRLEAARARREAMRDRLAAASLARLSAPDPDPAIFTDHTRSALDNLTALTTRPDQVAQLRQAILDLAVRGRLVPQDPSDEPASELLRRITAEIPARKADAPKHDDTPFEVPKGWVWTYLGLLVSHSDAGWSPKTEDHPRRGDEWGVLKVSAVSWGKFRAWENKQVLPGTEPRLQAQVKRGDFLISRANTAELIARAVIVNEEPAKLMMSDKIVRLRLSKDCNHRFVLIVNNYSHFSREHYVRNASGVSPSMKNVSRDVIMTLRLPLPPLAEQHRIVSKVDTLMALCDRLEASLTAGDDHRGRLLDALLAEALVQAENFVPVKAERVAAHA
jgi:type I restriction enzyme S subunit